MANFKGRYQEYLESPEWDELRKEAYKQTNHRCELCGDFAEAVHHIKYPKSFNEDCLENLLVVCDRCHKLLHGLAAETLCNLTRSENDFLMKLLDEVMEWPKSKKHLCLQDIEIVCARMGIRIIAEIKKNMFRVDR